MAIDPGVLRPAVLDVGEVDRLTDRLAGSETARGALHASQLRDILDLDQVYADAGLALQTAATIALTWNCSEDRAASRLYEARCLDRLGALPAMAEGLLTVEQGRVVVDVL